MSELFCYFEKDGVRYEVFLTRSIKARKIIFTFKKGALYVTYPKILKVNKATILNGVKENGPVLIERELNRGKPYDDKGVYFLGEYIPSLQLGLVDDIEATLAEMNAKLTDAGLELVEEEMMSQYTEWLATQ